MSYLKRLEQQKNELELSLKRNNLSESNMKRKERTRRLIQKGALLEKYFDCEHLSPKETEEFLNVFSDFIKKNTPDKYKKRAE
ncbi:hypothetical protein DTX80_17740 [Bacilli bacterium]|nr:hypothetical protein WH51_11465 [Bacilli bacterium VT-13-104]PZD83168.1 hypothetical protein DEJ64_15980 [Bacilli bacterium]PZD84280.1 hypothetical protein DEJ60_15000 [Bacilli bacterium]PZD86299.1 hypothetical protein DEJ66_15680 [Bacilli bacterium]RCO04292.1 hypothetical protein DTX80_17740 [Bacilli bacterium]